MSVLDALNDLDALSLTQHKDCCSDGYSGHSVGGAALPFPLVVFTERMQNDGAIRCYSEQ